MSDPTLLPQAHLVFPARTRVRELREGPFDSDGSLGSTVLAGEL